MDYGGESWHESGWYDLNKAVSLLNDLVEQSEAYPEDEEITVEVTDLEHFYPRPFAKELFEFLRDLNDPAYLLEPVEPLSDAWDQTGDYLGMWEIYLHYLYDHEGFKQLPRGDNMYSEFEDTSPAIYDSLSEFAQNAVEEMGEMPEAWIANYVDWDGLGESLMHGGDVSIVELESMRGIGVYWYR